MRVHKAEDNEYSFTYGDMLGSRTRIAILSQALNKIITSSAHRLRDSAKKKHMRCIQGSLLMIALPSSPSVSVSADIAARMRCT
jgi:hypothetical protein